MKILFRADSSSKIGLGHIMRDLVLAKQFEDVEIIFACRDLSGHIMDQIPYPIMIVDSDSIDELIMIVKSEQIDMVVIDHYGIGYEEEKRLKEGSGVKIFVLDDTYERHYCDVLLNHNISADEKRYEGLVPKGCELRCGSDYTLIREEFISEKKIAREKIYDLFISLGGADTEGLTEDILKMLGDEKSVVVLSTSSNKNLPSLKAYVEGRANIDLYIDSQEVAKVMNQSKFALVTPSVMVHEVLYMGVDFATLKIAKNQEEIHQYLKAHGYASFENISELGMVI
jgi:UDP-2,4-diacetamido-2,4,6-trideoxy-beta-L-altropyranose hydrolase